MSIFELDIKAKEYLEIVAKISELEALKKSMQEIFQSVMIENGNEILTGTNWRATWHNTKTERIDTKALKEALPDIYKEYSKTTVSTRFTLNQIKAG